MGFRFFTCSFRYYSSYFNTQTVKLYNLVYITLPSSSNYHLISSYKRFSFLCIYWHIEHFGLNIDGCEGVSSVLTNINMTATKHNKFVLVFVTLCQSCFGRLPVIIQYNIKKGMQWVQRIPMFYLY